MFIKAVISSRSRQQIKRRCISSHHIHSRPHASIVSETYTLHLGDTRNPDQYAFPPTPMGPTYAPIIPLCNFIPFTSPKQHLPLSLKPPIHPPSQTYHIFSSAHPNTPTATLPPATPPNLKRTPPPHKPPQQPRMINLGPNTTLPRPPKPTIPTIRASTLPRTPRARYHPQSVLVASVIVFVFVTVIVIVLAV